MRKMILCPTIESYTATPKSGVISTEVDSGKLRVRKDFLNSPTIVEISWNLHKYSEIEYMQAFFRSGINEGADKFLIQLQGLDQQDANTGLNWYEVLMVPDTFKVDSNEGKFLFTYSCTLEVKSKRADSVSDLTKLIQAETLGNTTPFDP